MDLLLDTHVFMWWQMGDRRLGGLARETIESAARVFVSAVSVWEIAIKRRAGKLVFEVSPVPAISGNGFVELPISGGDAERAGSLDWAHSDPFDRLLVAQAERTSGVLVTADREIAAYRGIAQLWAGA